MFVFLLVFKIMVFGVQKLCFLYAFVAVCWGVVGFARVFWVLFGCFGVFFWGGVLVCCLLDGLGFVCVCVFFNCWFVDVVSTGV